MIRVKKLRVGVIYGGRSGEHEVSVASAAAIFKHLDRERYEAVPMRIEKSGQWVLGGRVPEVLSAADVVEQRGTEALQVVDASAAVSRGGLDVVFPVLHGPYGEDGTVQGLLELADIPYVGSGVLGSAVGMDKAVMKTLFAAQGLPIVPHLTVMRREWLDQPGVVADRAATVLRFPMFVKPANLGSSVGISKVKAGEDFTARWISRLSSTARLSSRPGCSMPVKSSAPYWATTRPKRRSPARSSSRIRDGFYAYEAKYIDPRGILENSHADIRSRAARLRSARLSVEAFRAVEGARHGARRLSSRRRQG